MKPIITSILDLDLYKLTVQQIAFNLFSNVITEYEFTCRNAEKVDLLRYVPQDELLEQLDALAQVQLTEDEYLWLKEKGYYQETYLQYLLNFRFMPEQQLEIIPVPEKRTYRIRSYGPWAGTILYETMVLAIVNQIYGKNYIQEKRVSYTEALFTAKMRLNEKIHAVQDYNTELGSPKLKIIEFGTRRRFSSDWQRSVLDKLLFGIPDNIIGTSNVKLAKEFGIPEIGTFGHEFPMVLQGLYPVQKSQVMAARIWLQEYKGMWGTMLGDTLGDEKFFKDFTFDLAKGYDGVRHDSGEPAAYAERVIEMYKGYRIDPLTKKIVFSDGLDIASGINLHRQFYQRINVFEGIGTSLTNDVGIPVPQNVMKAVMSNGQDVCKLSANPDKASCRNPLYLSYTRMAVANY